MTLQRFMGLWISALILIGVGADSAYGMMQGGMRCPMRSGTQSAGSVAVPEQVRQAGCMSCHSISQAGMGPAFSWVSWKYQGHQDALPILASFIEKGGRASWGGTMPNLHIPATEARQMARWILSLTPERPPES